MYAFYEELRTWGAKKFLDLQFNITKHTIIASFVLPNSFSCRAFTVRA
jgi:hypothetical protein